MTDRSSNAVRIARKLQNLPWRSFQFLERPIINAFRRSDKLQSIFVLALPRSGSTLAYQILCHGLRVNYLSNAWNVLYQLPLLGGVVSGWLAAKHYSNFQSVHGFVGGAAGPAEGLRFWEWWLGCGLVDDVALETIDQEQWRRCQYLCRTLSTLGRWWGPFVTTFLGHTLAPDRLRAAFPDSLIIRLRRDPVSNALALLNCMRGENVKWFSVKPRECDEYERADEFERAAAQVYWLNRRLDDAACAGDMMTIHYEKLCENPRGELERIREWCYINGLKLELKFELPLKFDRSSRKYSSESDKRRVSRALRELEERYGKLVM